jgi:hypothetical protein
MSKILKDILYKVYSSVSSEDDRKMWSSAFQAFFKSQLEVKLIVENNGSMSHMATEIDR